MEGPLSKEVRRCPTLPRGRPRSTIGAEGLSFRVRNVTGRFPFAMAAETLLIYQSVYDEHAPPQPSRDLVFDLRSSPTVDREPQSGREHILTHPRRVGVLSSHRLISTGQLQGSLVPSSTSCLSTQSSGWEPLTHKGHGSLILRPASRLDAFSGYPSRT